MLIHNRPYEEYNTSFPHCQFIRGIKYIILFLGGHTFGYLFRWNRYDYFSCFISLWLYMDVRNNFWIRCFSISLVYIRRYGRNIQVDSRTYVCITSLVGWVRCCMYGTYLFAH